MDFSQSAAEPAVHILRSLPFVQGAEIDVAASACAMPENPDSPGLADAVNAHLTATPPSIEHRG